MVRCQNALVVPKVSEFFGIAIYIYYDDHAPALFHARYQGAWARVAIDALAVLDNDLTPRALALVMEWAAPRLGELARAWDQASSHQEIDPIEPLR